MKNLHNGTSPLQKKKVFLVENVSSDSENKYFKNCSLKGIGGNQTNIYSLHHCQNLLLEPFWKKENFQKCRVLNADFDACFCS